MKKSSVVTTAVFVAFWVCHSQAQVAAPRDPQAVLLAAQSSAAMGGTIPTATAATGTAQLVEGSLEETGRIRILTRGWGESREEVQTPSGLRGRVFSNGLAGRLSDAGCKEVSLELAASSQTPNFPLVLLARALNDPDFAFAYVGLEEMEGVSAHHIRFWNSYASKPKLKPLAEFTVKDLWIDAATGLPRALFYDQREAGGDAPRILVGARYSDYRNVGGVLYPFLVERIFNGTLWATIRIDNVFLNASLSDADFAVK